MINKCNLFQCFIQIYILNNFLQIRFVMYKFNKYWRKQKIKL